jgi:hypothetical protein
VLTFAMSDDEPICPPLPPVPEPRWDEPPASWSEIVRIVRARADDEMRGGCRTACRPGGAASYDRLPSRSMSTVVVETAQAVEGRWRARFTIDERVPEISTAEFVRIGR